MAALYFQQDDFVLTLDPAKVRAVKTLTYAYLFVLDVGSETVPFEYNLITQQILNLVKDNFEQPEQAQLSYRIEGFVATRFVLSFPDIKTYNEALQLVKDSLTAKFGHEPWIDQSVRCLEFKVNFPTYYSVYKENKALIISILGEPNHVNPQS